MLRVVGADPSGVRGRRTWVTVDIARLVDFICLLAMGQQTQFQLYNSSGSSPLAHNSAARNICILLMIENSSVELIGVITHAIV